MLRPLRNLARWVRLWAIVSFASTVIAHGQAPATVPADEPPVTLFPHSETARYWISGQDNIIFQWHPAFDAAYSGAHSFRSKAEHATSNVATIFLGFQLNSTTEFS